MQACAKHYINKYVHALHVRDSLLTFCDLRRSEQEHFRMQESSNVDDRTEHEIYFHPFLRSVQAGVASVMCSYSALFARSSSIAFLLTLIGRPDQRYVCVRERLHAQRASEEASRLPGLRHDRLGRTPLDYECGRWHGCTSLFRLYFVRHGLTLCLRCLCRVRSCWATHPQAHGGVRTSPRSWRTARSPSPASTTWQSASSHRGTSWTRIRTILKVRPFSFHPMPRADSCTQ